MNIAICGIDEAPYILKKWATKTISLLDPGMAFPKPKPADVHLIVNFDDVDFNKADKIMPQMAHVEQILDFSGSFTPTDRVLIHCHAGISRSTAIAIGILIQHGFTVDDAFKKVQAVRRILWPNSLIISYIDYKLDLNDHLIDYVHHWKLMEMARQSERRDLILPDVH